MFGWQFLSPFFIIAVYFAEEVQGSVHSISDTLESSRLQGSSFLPSFNIEASRRGLRQTGEEVDVEDVGHHQQNCGHSEGIEEVSNHRLVLTQLLQTRLKHTTE